MPKGAAEANPDRLASALLPRSLEGRAAADLEKAKADVEALAAAAVDAERSAALRDSELPKARRAAAEKATALRDAKAELHRVVAAKDKVARDLLDESHAMAAAAGKAAARQGELQGEVEAAEARCLKAKALLEAAEREAAGLESRLVNSSFSGPDEGLEEAREAAAAAAREAAHVRAIREEAEEELRSGRELVASTDGQGPNLSAEVGLTPPLQTTAFRKGT
jgi:chromosome segregation ATPase